MTTNPDLRIMNVLDLSTAHLPQAICTDLAAIEGVIAYNLNDHGWLLWVPNDVDGHAEDYEGAIPEEVLVIQRFACENACDYILLDRDADAIEALPTWDW